MLQQELRCQRRPQRPAVARAQLHPHTEDLDYLAAPDADVVLLEDGYEDDEDLEDYEDYAAASIADEELAMAEYSADDYEPEPEQEPEPELELEPEPVQKTKQKQKQMPAKMPQPEPTPEYIPMAPEDFAKLSKKAQKLERERMNPKFRKLYNL